MDKVLRNVALFAGIILVIAAVAMALVLSENKSESSNTQNTVETTTTYVGDVQKVKLSVSKGQYILTPSTLQKDIPVRMEVDLNTVFGCARAVVIKDFGVNKYVSKEDNIIEFTPTKTGEIEIACSMKMYVGTFTVI